MVALSITTSVYDVTDEIQRQTILGGSSEFYHLACALGALLCAVYLVQLSAKVLSGSGAWRPWDIVKPVVILLLVQNFNLVTGVVDGTIGVVCKGIAGYTSESYSWDVIDNFRRELDEWTPEDEVLAEQQLQDSAEDDADGETGFLGVNWPKVGTILDSVKDWCFDTLKAFFGITASLGYSLLAQLVATLAEWIGYIILIFSKIYLLVLAFIGPFVFAISIIPTFHQGIGQWVARYIQISFWYPILQIINLVYTQFVSHIPDMMAGAESMDTLMAMNTMSTLLLLFVSIAVIFMYFSVPKVAAWLIQSTGSNNAHNNAGRAASAAVATVAKAVV